MLFMVSVIEDQQREENGKIKDVKSRNKDLADTKDLFTIFKEKIIT